MVLAFFAFGDQSAEIENGKFQVIAMRAQGHDLTEAPEVLHFDKSPQMNETSDFDLVMKRIDHKQIMKGG